MKKIYIVGAGGFGREIVWLIERINEETPTWDIAGFIDDDVSIHGKAENGRRAFHRRTCGKGKDHQSL